MAGGSPRRGAERAIPLAYLGMALVLFVVLLPTVLRPAVDPANTAAEFSPDAPPDENQDAVVAALNRGISGTAGATGGAAGDDTDAAPGAADPPPPPPPARFGRCFGNPPRQVESFYAPPCAPAWAGDNGGFTSKGVTPTEVRVTVSGPDAGYEGAIRTETFPGENAVARTYRVFQEYFNSRFLLYGRQLRLYALDGARNEEDAAAQAALADSWGIFGGITEGAAMQSEFARRKMISFGLIADQPPASFLQQRRPYAWAWTMDATRVVRIAGDLICRQLEDKPALHAGDAEFRSRRRVFGLAYLNDNAYGELYPELTRWLEQECGAEIKEIVGFSNLTGENELATAITKFRAAGVTSVVTLVAWPTSVGLTHAADAQQYSPEWVFGGIGAGDNTALARLHHPDQWAHALGVTALEIERMDEEQDGWAAYKSIASDSSPDANTVIRVFPGLLQLAGGIQAAGPRLTPETFEAGQFRRGKRAAEPHWTIGGGFAPQDYSFGDDAGVVWWDPSASTVNGGNGAYRFVRNGRRFGIGQIPTEPLGFFTEGTSVPPVSE